MRKKTIAALIVVILFVIAAFMIFQTSSDGGQFFDYNSIYISEDDIVISVLNDDIDRPLAAYYFAEQQGKKHNAYLVDVEKSMSVKIVSWGWSLGGSLGKSQQREEYTYHYRFYYKKRGK